MKIGETVGQGSVEEIDVGRTMIDLQYIHEIRMFQGAYYVHFLQELFDALLPECEVALH